MQVSFSWQLEGGYHEIEFWECKLLRETQRDMDVGNLGATWSAKRSSVSASAAQRSAWGSGVATNPNLANQPYRATDGVGFIAGMDCLTCRCCRPTDPGSWTPGDRAGACWRTLS